MIEWEKIRKEFEENSIAMNALANKHGVKYSTLRSRKNRGKWQRNIVLNQVNVATDKPGGQKRNQNAKDNKGGSAPKGNKNATTHGLFTNWMPEVSLRIIEELKVRSPADMIWDNIMIQYVAIIRAQKIMYVEDENDLSKECKKESYGENVATKEWDIQYAWDKQANFMNAQSRAIGTLSSLIKQFILLSDEEDERRLKLEAMSLHVEKSKTELIELKNSIPNSDQKYSDDLIAAIDQSIESVWGDDGDG